MNNELQVFHSSEFGNVRVIKVDGKPWFVAADVCKALEIANNRDAVARLDDDEKGVVLTDTLGGKQEMQIINEPGLYTLVLGSRKPEAKAFKRWITHEVIPSIRKTGGYQVKKDSTSEAQLKRLDIMDRNSRTRAANLLLRIAERTKIPEYKEVCHAKAAEILSGTPVLPKPVANRKKTYSAAEIGEMFDDLVPAIETLLG